MPWFKNVVTGVCWEIDGDRQLDIARGNADLEELTGAPESVFATSDDIDGPVDSPEAEENTTEAVGDPLEGMEKPELKDLAKSMGVTGVSKMNVDQLKEAIRNAE